MRDPCPAFGVSDRVLGCLNLRVIIIERCDQLTYDGSYGSRAPTAFSLAAKTAVNLGNTGRYIIWIRRNFPDVPITQDVARTDNHGTDPQGKS